MTRIHRYWCLLDKYMDKYLRSLAFAAAVVVVAVLVGTIVDRINTNEDNLVRVVCFQADYLDRVAKQELRLSKTTSEPNSRAEHADSYRDIKQLADSIRRELPCGTNNGDSVKPPEVK